MRSRLAKRGEQSARSMAPTKRHHGSIAICTRTCSATSRARSSPGTERQFENQVLKLPMRSGSRPKVWAARSACFTHSDLSFETSSIAQVTPTRAGRPEYAKGIHRTPAWLGCDLPVQTQWRFYMPSKDPNRSLVLELSPPPRTCSIRRDRPV